MAGTLYPSDEQIAIICHYVNMGIQRAFNEPTVSPPWDTQDPQLQLLLLNTIRACKQGAGPAEIHQLWSEGMQRLGYETGPQVRHSASNGPLTHPNVGTGYTDMPPVQRLKDDLTVLLCSYLSGWQL